MRAVFAGNVAEIALNAEIVVNARDGFVVKIEVAPIRDARNAQSDNFIDARKAFVVQII